MPTPTLIAEATRKSAVVWIAVDDGPQQHPVWQVWHEDRMYVVTGGLEQPLPAGERAVVAVRSKDRQADLLVRWVAVVAPVPPATAQWDEVVPLLHAARLNAPDGEDQPARWARESTVLCFTPTGETLPLTTT
jgi:hypothetical protein